MDTKTCTKCDKEKPLSDFSKKKSRKDGLNTWCKSCMNESSARWRQRNQNYSNEWAAANREKRRTYGRKWRENNRDRASAASAAWIKANPEKNRAYVQSRRARKLNAPQAYFPTLSELIGLYGDSCMVDGCSSVDLEIDHVVPLSKGGSHSGCNAQLLCKSHNSAKGNRNSADYRPKEVLDLLPESWYAMPII